MLRGLFITGTDTGVGKTVVAAAIMHRYRATGNLRYWKPIQTGIEQDDDSAAVRWLGACGNGEILAEGVRLARPLSPHLAARLSGRTIRIQELVRLAGAQPEPARWVVEGAGGALVPINSAEKMTDLMAALGLPAVVVARSTLGTINHTLLTLEALRNRSLRIAGVVMVGEKNAENRAAIEQFGDVSVLAEMPFFRELAPAALAKWAAAELDPPGRLLEFLK